MTPSEFLREYEQRTNTHHFDQVAPLIAKDAVYWFNDGSFHGTEEIKRAFEKTWAFIRDEQYSLKDVQWLISNEEVAVCVYTFHWQGTIEGQTAQGLGRGTSVLRKVNIGWEVIHEHLSSMPL